MNQDDRSLHVVVVSQYFPPETGACAARMSALTKYLTQSGIVVTVVSAIPNYPTGVIAPADKGRVRATRRLDNGTTVVNTWVRASPSRSAVARLLSWVSFAVSSLLGFRFTAGADVVIATSGPLFVVVPALLFAGLRRARFILDVRDVWPSRATSVMNPAARKVIDAFLRPLESLAYGTASRIVAATQGVADELVRRGAPADHVATIHSGAEVGEQEVASEERISDLLGPAAEAADLVLCSGSIGLYQAPETVLRMAERLAEMCPGAWVVFAGEGPLRGEMEVLKKRLGVGNVHFAGNLTPPELSGVLSRTRIGIVSLSDKSELHMRMTVPRRMVDYLVWGVPVVYGGEGEGADLVTASEAGRVVPAGDHQAMAEACADLLSDRAAWSRAAAGASQLARTHFSAEGMAEKFLVQIRSALRSRSD